MDRIKRASVLPNLIEGESNLDRLPSMVRGYLEVAHAMIGRVPYHLRRLVVSVEDSPLATVGLNQLWVLSTISKYCMLMTKMLITMVRTRDSAPVDDEPFVNVLGNLHPDLGDALRISFLTSKVDEMRTGMTKISFRSTQCCCTFADRRRVESFNTGRKPVAR